MPTQVLEPRHCTNSLIECAIIICAILAVAVIFTGILVFISYLATKPKVPKVTVSRAQLNTIHFDQAGLLTVQLKFVVRAENDNSKARAIFYDTSLDLSFRGQRLVYLVVHPFNVGSNSTLELKFVAQASAIPLTPEEADHINLSLNQGFVTFEMNGTTRARWKVGLIESVKFWLHLPVDRTVVNPNCSSRSN